MAYITYQQYLDLYGICPISEEEFPVYAGLASDMIDSITRYRIVEGGGISALPSILQTLVQKAAAAQVLYFTQIGLETVLTGQACQSFTVGKVSVSGGALSSTTTKPGALMVSLSRFPCLNKLVDGKRCVCMLRPIPQSLLGDLAIIKVCTGMDAWQKPVWQDYEVSRVHLQNTNEVKKDKGKTPRSCCALRCSLTPGFQGPSWIMILWRNIPKKAGKPLRCEVFNSQGQKYGEYEVLTVDPVPDVPATRVHHVELGLV